MHVLLTGSRGFIGGHLLKVLTSRGVPITPILFGESNNLPGSITYRDFVASPKDFIRQDSVVIHCASSGVYEVESNTTLTKVNVERTAQFLKAAVDFGVKKVLVCGSGLELSLIHI